MSSPVTPSPAFYHIARITLETATPLSIATGKANGVFDSTLVLDANGLPAIPGSSIAGVLRHLYEDEYGKAAMRAVFGYQDIKHSEDSKPSMLQVSWGCIQNSRGKAIQGLVLDQKAQNAIRNDPILGVALSLGEAPVTRDRVRLSHKGVAADKGKFDRAVLPAGYRFTVELSMWAETADNECWRNVLKLLKHPLFRLGGSTRAGLGKLTLVDVHTCIADLRQSSGREQFVNIQRDMNDHTGFKSQQVPKWEGHKTITATMRLKPNSYWRIGQGIPGEHNRQDEKGKNADLLPKLEQRISWSPSSQQAEGAVEKLLIPASSVKGALSHRVAFHANRFSGLWAKVDKAGKPVEFDKSEDCETIRQLFGFARDEERKDEQKGQAGCVLIDDAYQTFSTDDLQIIMHNSIDRFSGSVRDRMLFSEEMVWGKNIELQLTIKTQDADGNGLISTDAKKALRYALEDLRCGRLALGAGAAKGHGFFKAEKIEWSDGGKWIGEAA